MLKKLIITTLVFVSSAITVQAVDQAAAPQNFIIAEIPIFSQKLRFKLPTDWQHANTSHSKTSYLIEFIPKDESIENWKNLISIQAFKDFDQTINPQDVANSIANNFAKICPKTVVYTQIGERVLNGHKAFLAVIGCSIMPTNHATNLKKGMSEISYFVFIKGKKDLYFAQKSIRGEGFTPNKFPASVEKSIADMKNFFPIEFCTLDSSQGQCIK